MNDREARGYAISALASIAGELRSYAIDDEDQLHELAGRVEAAAGRLAHELPDPDPMDVLRQAVLDLRNLIADEEIPGLLERVDGLEEKVDLVVQRVIGGPPKAGFVPEDGPGLDRAID